MIHVAIFKSIHRYKCTHTYPQTSQFGRKSLSFRSILDLLHIGKIVASEFSSDFHVMWKMCKFVKWEIFRFSDMNGKFDNGAKKNLFSVGVTSHMHSTLWRNDRLARVSQLSSPNLSYTDIPLYLRLGVALLCDDFFLFHFLMGGFAGQGLFSWVMRGLIVFFYLFCSGWGVFGFVFFFFFCEVLV